MAHHPHPMVLLQQHFPVHSIHVTNPFLEGSPPNRYPLMFPLIFGIFSAEKSAKITGKITGTITGEIFGGGKSRENDGGNYGETYGENSTGEIYREECNWPSAKFPTSWDALHVHNKVTYLFFAFVFFACFQMHKTRLRFHMNCIHAVSPFVGLTTTWNLQLFLALFVGRFHASYLVWDSNNIWRNWHK